MYVMATRIPAKLSEKVADHLDEHASRHERQARKEAKRAEALDKLASRLSVLDVWTRTGPSGRRPRFTRDEIAAAAVRIADDEGFASLSMRRLAAELDAGTMTLYHYVRTKYELLMLVTDAVLGEVVVDEPLPDDWRAAMTVLAHRTRDALVAHPWILDITDDPAIGPNSVRHFDQSLEAVSSLPADLTLRLDLVSAVDEYVFGHCLAARNNLSDPAPPPDMVRYVQSLLATGDYPQLFELAETLGLDVGWKQIEGHLRDAQRFDRNLARLLDGFAAEL
jgi:AcrR family transcriptional regulator